MINILVLLGRSATGKDSIFNELVNNFGYNRMATYTTRPMRDNETQDVDYHFISTENFLKKYIDGFFHEVRYYITKEGIWFYGSAIEDYEMAKENTVVILTPDGLKKVREKEIQCTAILIDVDDEEILSRQKKRGDNKFEAERRFESDKRDFEDAYSLVDFVVKNDKDIETVAKDIDLLHMNWRIQE